jgi:2'-hydroxyisoflavone reductase
MDLLVLGGSDFAGRSLVADALAGGWNVTTLHRGRREPAAGVTALVGDRPTPGGNWLPRATGNATSSQTLGRGLRPLSETRPPGSLSARPLSLHVEPVGARLSTAGRQRRGCGRRRCRLVLARPRLIDGPHEDIGRLPWRLSRIARGGDVPAPTDPGNGIQLIDARGPRPGLRQPPSRCKRAGSRRQPRRVRDDGRASRRVRGHDRVPGPPAAGELRDPSHGRRRMVGGPAVWFPQGEAQDTMHGARCLTRAGDRAQVPPGVRDRLRHLGRGLQTAAACPAAPGQAPVGLRLEVEARILAAL